MERFFRFDSYMHEGPSIKIGTDASPCGMGGWLAENGIITNFFACPVTDDDAQIYSVPVGTPKEQQIWERLAVLIGVSLWLGPEREQTSLSQSEATTSEHSPCS